MLVIQVRLHTTSLGGFLSMIRIMLKSAATILFISRDVGLVFCCVSRTSRAPLTDNVCLSPEPAFGAPICCVGWQFLLYNVPGSRPLPGFCLKLEHKMFDLVTGTLRWSTHCNSIR